MSMRLIDADALLESGIYAEYGYNDNGLLLIPMRDVTNSIRNAPTIDAEPMRHGRWQGEGDGYADGYPVMDVWYCSECGYCIDDGTDDPSFLPKYCPNCGAKMDGEAD